MTDFEKIKNYYCIFDEQGRLAQDEGRLEYEISLKIICNYISPNSKILDLGGGAGRYSIELAQRGHSVVLADLSPALLEQAQKYIYDNSLCPLESIDEVNALDLSRYSNETFDYVILFGPLYHLLEKSEREQCVSEVNRVLKKDGMVFASFIPYLSGISALVDRAIHRPEQCDSGSLVESIKTNKFHNNSQFGFQEGYYPESKEIVELFDFCGFDKLLLRSIRGVGYEKEREIFEIETQNPLLFEKIFDLIESTSERQEIIETCSHALYVGKKK